MVTHKLEGYINIMKLGAMLDFLAEKKILFIGPKSFGYEQEIISNLEKIGATVDYYNDRPFQSNLKKIILRLFPWILHGLVKDYFNNLIKVTSSNEYDYVFCIKLECFPLNLFKKLRTSQKKAVFIFYNWDSFVNNSNPLTHLNLFDKIMTFDDKDSKKYKMIHRPLFFIDKYREIKNQPLKYDIAFIGSVHVHRYKFIKKFLISSPKNMTFFIYFYVPSKLLFFTRKLLLFPIYGSSKLEEFNFNSLSQPQIVNIFSKSNIILDYALPTQEGLTMRSIEALGAQKKLITNNKSIQNYDFYDKNNVLVIKKNCIEIPESFMTEAYIPIEPSVYEKYSIQGWIYDIFSQGYIN
ncbi:MAG: hypothetical protein GY828_05360 [Candidatus Gracilibacteria bacterium]|nr:hypothetical protein [Candidatus Gracilibacteria bacterium]